MFYVSHPLAYEDGIGSVPKRRLLNTRISATNTIQQKLNKLEDFIYKYISAASHTIIAVFYSMFDEHTT
jgi:hypothetical protein